MTTTNEKDQIRQRIYDALIREGVVRNLDQGYDGITENARKVLERRYLAKDREGNILEDTDGMFRRVAENLAQADANYGATPEQVEDTEEKFFNVMRCLEMIPNSPTLMNAGRELQQLSACFVLPVEDTIEGIFESVKQTALIHKSGGGTGFSFSRLRPSGDMVGTTGGVASGPVSFIRAFDTATDVVKQGGTRRGANMAILRVDHPDILEFIRSKADGVNLSNFNISVAINHKFMEKAHNNQDYELMNPHSGKVAGTLNAKEVFEEIVRMAWQTGDPGIVFLDRINRDNPNPQLGEIESTNPCVTGDTLVYTQTGLHRARDLFETQERTKVVTDGRFGQETLQQATEVFYSGIKPVYHLKTQEGYEVRVTRDHKVMTDDGWVHAEKLEEGQKIHILNRQGSFGTHGSQEMGEILGWLVGDGTLKQDRAVLSFFGRKRVMAQDFAEMMNRNVPAPQGPRRNYTVGVVEIDNRDESRVSSGRFLKVAQEYGITPGDKHHVPEKVMTGSQDIQTGFLRGIFSADAHVSQPYQGGAGIHLTSIDYPMLQDIQRMLLNQAIPSQIYKNRRPAGTKELPDGHGGTKEYNNKAYHELVVTRSNIATFRDNIGFIDQFKHDLLELTLESYQRQPDSEPFTARFTELVPDGMEEVFDLTEPVTHSFIANGIAVSNCGEQPLLPNESCNLASINLVRMLRHDQGYPEIDWEALSSTVSTTVHMLDNVIDMNNYPLAAIEEMSRKTRRIGVGVMGFADILIQMGFPYDSQDALDLAEKVMKFIQEKTHESSGMLAGVRGNFPAWEGSIYGPNGENKPMRNSAPVTIAPTGTISIIAGASSGIEPLFALSYVRDVMDHTRLVEVNPYLEAVAKHEGFYSEELMKQLAQTGTLKYMDVPEWVAQVFQTSQDISPTAHVKMQAIFQRYTDNSVSKTINFAHDATIEDVRKAYLTAYNTGCKGVTVYRDGSKAEQVLSTGQTGETHKDDRGGKPEAKERPSEVHGITERMRTGHGNMYVTTNFDEDGKPFEAFTTLGKAGGCDSAQLEAISRLISLCLRSDIDVDDIIYNLKGITCCPSFDQGVKISSAPDAVAISLERQTRKGRLSKGPNGALKIPESNTPAYQPALTAKSQEEELKRRGLERAPKCPDCNTVIQFKEGCASCPDPSCGWNRCD